MPAMRIENVFRAASVEEAYKEYQRDKTSVLFGGGAWIKLTLKEVANAILIDGLGLDEVLETPDAFEIGPMCTLAKIVSHPGLGILHDGILPQACHQVMGIAVENIATIGGSVMGGFAFSDVITPLLAMDAKLLFHKHEPMAIADFLAKRAGFRDILVGINVPKTEGRGYFHKIAKTRLDFAILNIAIVNVNGLYAIAVGARPGIAKLAVAAMDRLNEIHPVGQYDIENAAAAAIEELEFGGNNRASAEYRRSLAKTYILRGLKEVTFDENQR